ncbi:MAG: GNAT family N-acetyltransferase [Neisseriaceae bacterium]
MAHGIVRAICPEDLEKIRAIDVATNPHPWGIEALKYSLRHHLGFVHLQSQYPTSFLLFSNQVTHSEILLLATAPAHQRNSLATRLIKTLVDYNRHIGLDRILLEVRASNSVAQSFYKKNGFSMLGVRKTYYSSPTEDALVLEKKC